MAEAMSMNKIIHGAVRRDLERFKNALGNFPDGSAARAEQLLTAWTFFYGELDYHHHGEHEIAWPALESVGVPRSTLDQMDAEHARMADALAAAGTSFDALATTPTADAAQSAAAAIADLETVVTEHLAHEEAELEPVYQANRAGPEMKAMGKKFAQRGATDAGNFFAWVLNGATDEEKAALRVDVPPPVIAILPRLFGRRYRSTVAPVWR